MGPCRGELLALVIDSKHLLGDCAVVALEGDVEGKKYLLGLWQGGSENATVVKELLQDLVSDGLDPGNLRISRTCGLQKGLRTKRYQFEHHADRRGSNQKVSRLLHPS
jgi:transposase-like protein